MKLRVGLIVNPVAGLGGSAALKGSDGADIQAEARRRGAQPQAEARTGLVLGLLAARAAQVELLAWGGSMGAQVAAAAGLAARIPGGPPPGGATSAADTRAATLALCAAGLDVLVFAGGDGTARDVLTTLPAGQLVLGVPVGVKMHSSVFAVTPRAAAEVLLRLIDGGLVAVADGEVRDIDEAALRAGVLRNAYFGTMRVPALGHHMQHLKQGGREVDALAQQEIAVAVAGELEPGVCYLLGPGSTLLALKQLLGMRGTLLGVDVVRDGQQLAEDASERQLLALLATQPRAVIVLSPTRGQGALLGRGNQQLSAAVVRAVRRRLLVVASRAKLLGLAGRPLLVDTGDATLDMSLCGLIEVTAGFEDRLLYSVGTV